MSLHVLQPCVNPPFKLFSAITQLGIDFVATSHGCTHTKEIFQLKLYISYSYISIINSQNMKSMRMNSEFINRMLHLMTFNNLFINIIER